MENLKQISLDKFAKGALLEKFNLEMEKVSSNINDPNTSKTAQRTVTIKLVIKPDEDGISATTFSVTSSLAAAKEGSTKLIFGYDYDNKRGLVNEFNADMVGQIDMEELERQIEEKKNMPDNVIDLRQNKA